MIYCKSIHVIKEFKPSKEAVDDIITLYKYLKVKPTGYIRGNSNNKPIIRFPTWANCNCFLDTSFKNKSKVGSLITSKETLATIQNNELTVCKSKDVYIYKRPYIKLNTLCLAVVTYPSLLLTSVLFTGSLSLLFVFGLIPALFLTLKIYRRLYDKYLLYTDTILH